MGESEVLASSVQLEKISAESAGEMETLLSNPVTRALFLDDAMELKEFITWRLRELTMRTDNVLSGQVSHGVHVP